MDEAIPLLDTPKRVTLQSTADTLRASLKDYERRFAAQHDGRKPGKDDIKADAGIAAKYKEYNKVREVLAGKRSLDALNSPRPHALRKKHERRDSAISLTPHRSRHGNTPTRHRLHPNLLDPYDAPSSVSPKVIPTAIGPTPRRDGVVFGIFDMLSSAESRKGSHETPSSKKRKIDVLYGNKNHDDERILAFTQSPSQRRGLSAENRIQNSTIGTPRSTRASAKRQHSKTPVSEGRRFMLNHFFATPSVVRFADIVDGEGERPDQDPVPSQTPLRDAVLGISPSKGYHTQLAADATPPYLKRAFSFKERLLSVSEDAPRSLRHPRFAARPLSQIMADVQPRAPDNFDEDEDDLDALREMESDEHNILINDSQANEAPNGVPQNPGIEPDRVWKKKGQKRTTRRAIIRPSKVKPASAPKFVAEADDSEEDELALDSGDLDKSNTATRIEETQYPDHGVSANGPNSDLDEREEEFETYDDEDDFDPETELAGLPPSSKRSKSSSTGSSRPSGKSAQTKKKPSTKTKKKKDDQDDETSRTINPNAYSHMNFRSLKIKNKNSKAKGRGRFGRGARR